MPSKFIIWALSIALLAPSLHAAQPKPWDSMKGFFKGTIIVTTQEGERLEATDVFFNKSELRMQSGRIPIARTDVKEVEIHARRNFHLGTLALAITPIVVIGDAIVHHHRLDNDAQQSLWGTPLFVAIGVAYAPAILGMDVVEIFRPPRVYRVVP